MADKNEENKRQAEELEEANNKNDLSKMHLKFYTSDYQLLLK